MKPSTKAAYEKWAAENHEAILRRQAAQLKARDRQRNASALQQADMAAAQEREREKREQRRLHEIEVAAANAEHDEKYPPGTWWWVSLGPPSYSPGSGVTVARKGDLHNWLLDDGDEDYRDDNLHESITPIAEAKMPPEVVAVVAQHMLTAGEE